ncbi:hypothetical protein GQ457_01G015490 [Hibiscus cannabinus]
MNGGKGMEMVMACDYLGKQPQAALIHPPRRDYLGNKSILILGLVCGACINKVSKWLSPPIGFLEFNTDDAVRGNFVKVGIGGCLQNSSEKTLLYFSKGIGWADPTFTELAVIEEAIKLFLDWLKQPQITPIRGIDLSKDIVSVELTA